MKSARRYCTFNNSTTNGVAVLYDGYATFKEEGNTFTYSYVNGVGNLSTNGDKENIQCVPSSTFPFNAILPALNDATPISSASIGDEAVECASGNLFKTTFAGVHFAICVTGESEFIAYSSDFTIDVEYLEKPVKIPRTEEATCTAVATLTSLTPTALALITGGIIPTCINNTRLLKVAEHMSMEASSCKCKSTPRPCIFFHGIGNAHKESGR
ncbi:uncharacterized protein PITG_05964 [Phytophthora infestans T30-4]|uniref:Uncharacterized protein n=1 Tax=Phytophthora infestans (strain T30-4) TaxID=403677 RepID=D0N644_PHYIT|nr:uncharacterized protein PITG_05964 [Phytophthora infestans T30-4]EEY70535.1 conserved hypothetical protein [Phytophthora infestans T30-4]|eukprot:XP_002998189.1 conserved hypothetical protein [Phytophthora infestans T30-4]